MANSSIHESHQSQCGGSPEIKERTDHGLLILSPGTGKPLRRVLFINVSGGAAGWTKYKSGLMPSHRLWGCVELVRKGYEVGIADALPDFYLHRNPFPHDLRLLRAFCGWLKPGDIIYCAHNTLYWIPFLKKLGLQRCKIVSLLYAREPLHFARVHSGIIALNPAAEDHARRLAPRASVANLGWGMDLDFFPRLPYQPQTFLACGRTNRDHHTLNLAVWRNRVPIRLFAHQVPEELKWPNHVAVIQGGAGWETRLPYRELLSDHYANAAGSLVLINKDTVEYTACGFTNLIEAMAMARPVIVTRTGAVPSGIDVEREGCGVFVPPEDPQALAMALEELFNDPARAKAMGEKGRKLTETYYNMERFGKDLHEFFESL